MKGAQATDVVMDDVRERVTDHPPAGASERRRPALRRTGEYTVPGGAVAAYLTRPRGPAARYGLATIVTLVASTISVLAAPHLDRVVFMLLWPAVIFSALVGGFGPAALSSVLGVLVVDLFFFQPIGSVSASSRDAPALALFLFASLAMSSIADALRHARERSDAATREMHQLAMELEDQASELEQQLEESQTLQEELEQTSEELAARSSEAEEAGAFSRGILGSITDPLVVHDADWRFVYINDEAASIFRQSARAPRGSLIGARLWDAYPNIIGTPHEREMRRAATERVPVRYEAYNPDAGTWAVMSCFPMPDGGLVTQWRDVTARRRAEESARYLARASDVLGTSLDYETTLNELAQLVVPELAEWCAVYVVDTDGEPRQVSLAHADSERVSWAQAFSQRHPSDPAAGQGVHAVVRTGQPMLASDITDEMLVAASRGSEHLEAVRGLGLRSAMIVPLLAQDRVLGALAMYSVKTGRKYDAADLELATELARRAALAVDNSLRHRAEKLARVAADDANKVKMQFLAVMSHELRTPLNAIGGYAELLRLGLRGPVTEAQLQDLERISNSQRSLLGLINDILNFAKVEAGHVEFTIDDVPVRPLLRDLEELVHPQVVAGALELRKLSCDDDLTVRGDREKIRQIMLNLLTNAIKFTPGRGTISISCARVGNMVRVDVRDTGIGIAPDRLEAVFDPFVQLNRTLTSQHEGTGLGLAISRDLARGMKGDVTATSLPGVGSVFSLTLPAAHA